MRQEFAEDAPRSFLCPNANAPTAQGENLINLISCRVPRAGICQLSDASGPGVGEAGSRRVKTLAPRSPTEKSHW